MLFFFCFVVFLSFFTVHVQYLLQIVLVVSNGSSHGSCMFLKVRENIWYCQSMFSFYELGWFSVTFTSWCYVNQSYLSVRQTWAKSNLKDFQYWQGFGVPCKTYWKHLNLFQYWKAFELYCFTQVWGQIYSQKDTEMGSTVYHFWLTEWAGYVWPNNIGKYIYI